MQSQYRPLCLCETPRYDGRSGAGYAMCLECGRPVVRNPLNDIVLTDIVLDASQIASRVKRLAETVDAWASRAQSHPRELVLVGLATGCVMLLADLSRAIQTPHRLVLLHATRYRGAMTAADGAPELVVPFDVSQLDGALVVIVDEILDTGLTCQHVRRWIERTCLDAKVRVCALLCKRGTCRFRTDDEWVGADVSSSAFIVGYGMDYRGLFRNLPFIANAVRAGE